ncbi:MAG: DUF4355 domain-containing protein [Clostridiales bacterium]|nr:DUF4355 domain-containing protein [Clostridiales bacterium]
MKTNPGTGEEAGGAGAAARSDSGILGKIREILGMGKEEKKENGASEEKMTESQEGQPQAENKGKKEEPVKSYTQADLDAAVKQAREQLLNEQKEQKRREKLSPEERAEEDARAVRKQNDELTEKIRRMELEQKAAGLLEEKKLPSAFAEFLDFTSEEKMTSSLEKLGKQYQADLEAGIQAKLKGSTPKGLGSAANLTDGIISAEISRRIRGGM